MNTVNRLESMELTEAISGVLSGHEPSAIGAALADVLSIWLAGHHPELREALLVFHISQVRNFLSLSDAQIRRQHPHECTQWPPSTP